MSVTDPALVGQLRSALRHRLRPMTGLDADDERSSSPLELLYDLTYVIAFAMAAELLAHHIVGGAPAPAVGAYILAVFLVTWAWLNFTWFSSAYNNDDALFRVATLVQMVGVIVLTFGLPGLFEAIEKGENAANGLVVAGYIIMRVPLIGLWLRAAVEDRRRRAIAIAYAVANGAAQVAWVVVALLPLPLSISAAILGAFAVLELIAPVVLERRLGRPPWSAGHIGERFGLLTLITIGEVIAATTATVSALVGEQGWTPAAVVVVAAGVILAAAFWWTYYLVPSGLLLSRWPERVYAWRYVHLPLFGAIAAVGAGLRVLASSIESHPLTLLQLTLVLVIPVAAVLFIIFLTWSALLRSYDFTHVPLFAAAIAPLVAAVVVVAGGGDAPFDPEASDSLTRLIWVVGLVALSAIVEVVGHEMVGFRHTVRAMGLAGD